MRRLLCCVSLLGCSSSAATAPDARVADVLLTEALDVLLTEAPGLDVSEQDTRDGPVFRGDPSAPSKGPWVIRMEPTQAIVRWETRGMVTAPSVEVQAPEGMRRAVMATSRETQVSTEYTGLPGVMDPDLAGTWYVHQAILTGLAPASCYLYSVVGHPGANGRVCTAHEPMDRRPIRFMAIGDTNPILGHTRGILDRAQAMNPEFTIHLGDIQYYSAIAETWQYWFRAMAPMLRSGAFLPSIGNHEDELGGTEFADYYARLFNDPGRDGELEYYHYATGGVHFFSLSTEAESPSAQRQLAWLSERLTAVESTPGYRFSVMYFHRPVYTVGDTSPRLDLRESLGGLARTHRVPIVFQGHMHGYERFEVGAVTYITSGGGGGWIGNVNQNAERYPEDTALRRSAGAWYHAVIVTITQTSLRGQAIDEDGTVRDMFEKPVP